MKRLLVLLALSTSLGAASPLRAQVPETLSYQGVLTDGAGVPVPDGPYDLTFALYDAPTEGTLLWSETQVAVSVTDGGFSVLLGSVTPLSLPFDAAYHLGIAVGGDPELEPRIALASSPYSLGLRLPFTGNVSSAGAALTLGNTGGGPALVLSGPAGDSGVVLPPDAVSAPEVLDEPGVAGVTSETTTSLNTTPTTLLSRAITAPADGYVMAIGGCDATFYHVAGTADGQVLGVSMSSTTIPPTHDIVSGMGAAMPTDLYSVAMTVQGLFPVSAGVSTFYLLARRSGAGVIAMDKQLTLVYFPTAYGAVGLVGAPAGGGE